MLTLGRKASPGRFSLGDFGSRVLPVIRDRNRKLVVRPGAGRAEASTR